MRPDPAAIPPSAPAENLTDHLGMWAFLATEVLFFGGMFVAYTLYRSVYPEAFRFGAQTMEFGLGTINTAVLLTSSFLMACADRLLPTRRRAWTHACFAGTILLGVTFLAIKAFEYHSKVTHHLVPGPGFQNHSGVPTLQLFFVLYFAMTGLHAAHMVAGLGVITWVWRRYAKASDPAQAASPVAIGGLYWHFVDCVWVFLYPLFYLAGR
jgi:cytochrome c oxidase subunit 3